MARSSTRCGRAGCVAPWGIGRVGRAAARRRSGAALLALCLVSLGAAAEEAEEAKEPAWIPSLNFGFETFRSDTTSTVENFVNPPAQEGTQTVSNQQPLFQLGGELQGPMVEALPGRPRPFVQAGFALNPFSSDTVFSVGVIGTPEDTIGVFYNQLALSIKERKCDVRNPPTCPTREPGDFDGQGSQITASFLNPSWYASLGVAFNVPISRKLLFQVRPSLAYSGENVELVGHLTTVTEPAPEVFEVTRSVATKSETYHNLGAGLELALDLFRATRPIATALYVDARVLWLISDPTLSFSDDAGVAAYEVSRDNFTLRGGAGVRFSWKGFGAD